MTFDLISRNRKDKVYNSNCLNRSMENNISIEECLKELNDEVLKSIREDYKKGNNLNEIIKHHNSKKPETLTKVFDLIKFEYDEQKRFLKIYETIEEVRLFFPTINEINYKAVIDTTLKGMKDGVEDFLKRNKAYSLYLSVIDNFCYDVAAPKNIEKLVTKLGLPIIKGFISDYAVDVSGGYNFFLLNNSEKIFKRKFCKHKF